MVLRHVLDMHTNMPSWDHATLSCFVESNKEANYYNDHDRILSSTAPICYPSMNVGGKNSLWREVFKLKNNLVSSSANKTFLVKK